jgi:hypothetical protein
MSYATRKDAIEALRCDDWFGLSYEAQCAAVEKAKPGTEWRNVKTGKVVKIGSVNSWTGVTILHARGRVTTKQCHYFAYDYCPNNPGDQRPE